ncbi:MAG: hypothetical protein QOE93_2330, partial [Actinomycetota bacterium]|nr:hypothetical protein [Actinomycetota bacterium]
MSDADGVTRLPAELQRFFEVTLGLKWPEGDEGGLKAISRAWSAFADELDIASEDVASAANGIGRSLRGATSTRTTEYLNDKVVATIAEMAGVSRELANAARTAAADIQKTKIMLIAMAVMAMIMIAFLLWSIFTAFLVPAVELAAQVGLRELLKQLLAQIQRLTVKRAALAGLRLGGDIAKYAAGGAAFMFTLDFGIQTGQVIEGKVEGGAEGRGNYDWKSIGNSTIGGAIGGALFGAFHGITVGVGGGLLKGIARDIIRGPVKGAGKGASAGKGVGIKGSEKGPDVAKGPEAGAGKGGEKGGDAGPATVSEKGSEVGSGISEKPHAGKTKEQINKELKAEVVKVTAAMPRSLRGGGIIAYAIGQVGVAAASNPAVQAATGGEGPIWGGILSALSTHHSGKVISGFANEIVSKFPGLAAKVDNLKAHVNDIDNGQWYNDLGIGTVDPRGKDGDAGSGGLDGRSGSPESRALLAGSEYLDLLPGSEYNEKALSLVIPDSGSEFSVDPPAGDHAPDSSNAGGPGRDIASLESGPLGTVFTSPNSDILGAENGSVDGIPRTESGFSGQPDSSSWKPDDPESWVPEQFRGGADGEFATATENGHGAVAPSNGADSSAVHSRATDSGPASVTSGDSRPDTNNGASDVVRGGNQAAPAVPAAPAAGPAAVPAVPPATPATPAGIRQDGVAQPNQSATPPRTETAGPSPSSSQPAGQVPRTESRTPDGADTPIVGSGPQAPAQGVGPALQPGPDSVAPQATPDRAAQPARPEPVAQGNDGGGRSEARPSPVSFADQPPSAAPNTPAPAAGPRADSAAPADRPAPRPVDVVAPQEVRPAPQTGVTPSGSAPQASADGPVRSAPQPGGDVSNRPAPQAGSDGPVRTTPQSSVDGPLRPAPQVGGDNPVRPAPQSSVDVPVRHTPQAGGDAAVRPAPQNAATPAGSAAGAERGAQPALPPSVESRSAAPSSEVRSPDSSAGSRPDAAAKPAPQAAAIPAGPAAGAERGAQPPSVPVSRTEGSAPASARAADSAPPTDQPRQAAPRAETPARQGDQASSAPQPAADLARSTVDKARADKQDATPITDPTAVFLLGLGADHVTTPNRADGG